MLWVPRRHVSTWTWCLAWASLWQSTTHWRGLWSKRTENAEVRWPQPESQLSQAWALAWLSQTYLGSTLLPQILGKYFAGCWNYFYTFPVTCCFSIPKISKEQFWNMFVPFQEDKICKWASKVQKCNVLLQLGPRWKLGALISGASTLVKLLHVSDQIT